MGTLATLPQDFREKRFYDIAKIVCQYQYYQDKYAIEKMDNTIGKSTKQNYVTYGLKYLKTQVKSNIVPNDLYVALDKCIEQCIQPLRPTNEQRKRSYKIDFTKKENMPPITRNAILKKPLTAKIEYGVRINDTIVLNKTEDEARGFMRGINFLNPNQVAKIVTVELSEID